MTAVRVNVAARALGVSASQLRRWLSQGAPTVRERRPRLVDVEALRQWKQGASGDVIGKLEVACLDVLRRDAGVDGRTAPRLLDIPDWKAATLLLQVYDRTHIALTGHEPTEPYSAEIAALRAIALERARDARSVIVGLDPSENEVF